MTEHEEQCVKFAQVDQNGNVTAVVETSKPDELYEDSKSYEVAPGVDPMTLKLDSKTGEFKQKQIEEVALMPCPPAAP